ncbi:MAG: uroporphyrinogen-III C-methyltransferase [Candidatus Omnitrophota bacterium]|nr:uroporphyrinogen-III C-methyltransferase [Candidatus Omnitrophota bacterium]
MKNCKVYLIGAGPCGADLITVRGLKILRQADVIIHDYLVDKALLEEAKPGSELISCEGSGKKSYSGKSGQAQKKINDLIVKKANQGKRVVRLKNGDPCIFSRISEEISSLVKNKIEYEIVPGVTAADTAASFTGVPLTDRRFSSSVVFVTGHEEANKGADSINWKHIVNIGTIVLYMSVRRIADIAGKLMALGKSWDTPVIAISKAGSIDQKISSSRLKDISLAVKKDGIVSPAIFIIGATAGLEKQFNWFRKNKRILFTGLSGERFFIKGTYSHLSLIKIEPLEDYNEFDNYIRTISDSVSRRAGTATHGVGKAFDWIVFSSRFGVEYFFKRLKGLGLDARALVGVKIAAIGNCTKERLMDFTISADLVPEEESSKGLIDEFRKLDIKGRKIFLPRSDISDKGLEREFEKLGAKVTSSFAYRNVMAKGLPDLDINLFDEIMFTSPSGVRNFIKRYGKPLKRVRITCIGDVTKKEAERCGLLG